MRNLQWRYMRVTALGLVAALGISLTGCTPRTNAESRRDFSAPAPMASGPMNRSGNEVTHQGLTTKQKVVLLAGAAALYYLYQKHKQASGEGAEGKYYRSKNGQIYYRDEKGGVHWVTAPSQPIQVPADEYQRYTGQMPQGYNGEVLRQAPGTWQ